MCSPQLWTEGRQAGRGHGKEIRSQVARCSVHTYIPGTQEQRQAGQKFRDILAVRLCPKKKKTRHGNTPIILAFVPKKKKKPGALSYNCSTWEAEAGGSLGIQGQLVLHSKFETSLVYIVRPCLKKTKYFYNPHLTTVNILNNETLHGKLRPPKYFYHIAVFSFLPAQREQYSGN